MGLFDFFKKKDEKADRRVDSAKGRAAQNPESRERDKEQLSSDKVTPAGSEKSYKPRDRKPAPSHQYYEVQEGDSLSGIAKDHYGDPSKWKLIYERNKHEIENPDVIVPGQVLELPDINVKKD